MCQVIYLTSCGAVELHLAPDFCSVDRTKYQIQIPLPPKIDASVTMMTVEEKPDVTYSDIGGSKEQIDKMREVVELPMLHPEKFVALGIDPPKGVLCYGPPGTGSHLCDCQQYMVLTCVRRAKKAQQWSTILVLCMP